MDDNRNLFLLIVRISIEKLNLLPILSKCGHRIMIFCDVKNAVFYSKHFDVMEFEDIGENHLVELAVLDLRKDYNIKKIIVLEEHDIIRAAQLREYLNIEGQNLESALLFRDKFLLKQRVRGKIPVADYRLVESPIDIKEFIDEYDFPVVMKPRDGMGSIDVSIIRNLSELNLWVMHHYKSNILIEKYIAGEMYHVDGIIINNSIEFICVSRYIGTCLGSTKNEGLGSVILNENDSSHKALVSITKNLFQLISKPCNMTFHVEFFRKGQDFILCEAASRTGGAYVTRLINEKYGCNLDEWFVCAELGIPYIRGDKNNEIYAAMIVPPLKKRLISYPLEIPYSFCVYYERRGNEGQDYSNYGTCVGRYASFIVKGKTYDDVKLKIKEAKDYVERNTKWE